MLFIFFVVRQYLCDAVKSRSILNEKLTENLKHNDSSCSKSFSLVLFELVFFKGGGFNDELPQISFIELCFVQYPLRSEYNFEANQRIEFYSWVFGHTGVNKPLDNVLLVGRTVKELGVRLSGIAFKSVDQTGGCLRCSILEDAFDKWRQRIHYFFLLLKKSIILMIAGD